MLLKLVNRLSYVVLPKKLVEILIFIRLCLFQLFILQVVIDFGLKQVRVETLGHVELILEGKNAHVNLFDNLTSAPDIFATSAQEFLFVIIIILAGIIVLAHRPLTAPWRLTLAECLRVGGISAQQSECNHLPGEIPLPKGLHKSYALLG